MTRVRSIAWARWFVGAAGLLIALSLGSGRAFAGPSLELTLDPPVVTIEPCTNTTLTATVCNSGGIGASSDALRYVAITAVVSDFTRMELLVPRAVNARIVDPLGRVRWSGLVLGRAMLTYYQPFAPVCVARTFRLPTDVVLNGGERLILDIPAHCLEEGDVRVAVFPTATEDHRTTPPATVAGVTDKTNLYYLPAAKKVVSGWYPLHNSYDVSDPAYPTGHTFVQHSWQPRATTTAYAKDDSLIHQRQQWHTYESSCFREQFIEVPITVDFFIEEMLKVNLGDTNMRFGPTLPAGGATVNVPYTVWSNDDVECRVSATPLTGQATHTVIAPSQLTATLRGSPVALGVWTPITLGATGEVGVSDTVVVRLSPITPWVPDVYTGSVLVDFRQY